MKTVLFVHGGKVVDDAPTAHFLLRLKAALEYYHARHNHEDIVFFVSGRWTNVIDNFPISEAEVGKQYILQAVPEATVMKEDISGELIGNYAFSKPLIAALQPDSVVIFTSDLLQPRTQLIMERIFAHTFPYSFHFIHDELSANPIMTEREVDATGLFKNLFKDVADGDDVVFREKLLYETPYYFKGIIDEKSFFDTYWRGGFERFLNSRAVRHKG